MKITAPVTIEMRVHLTDGKKHSGVMTIDLGIGGFKCIEDQQKALEEAKDKIPEGYRLMTKKEFWDNFCIENFGQRMALSDDSDKGDFDPVE